MHKQGVPWGMTSNATLINKENAKRLKECGLKIIAISIDGLPKRHDQYRGLKNGFELAMQGLQNLVELDFCNTMVTTVVNHENINELDKLFELFDTIDFNEWRLTGLEPIGRAELMPEMHLTPEDNRRLMAFIKEKRQAGLPVTYSCCHFLGIENEAEVRDWYFLCNAGITVASILVNGDVTACLDIPHNQKTVQGNIHDTSFTEIWNDRFEIFRMCLSGTSQLWSRNVYAMLLTEITVRLTSVKFIRQDPFGIMAEPPAVFFNDPFEFTGFSLIVGIKAQAVHEGVTVYHADGYLCPKFSGRFGFASHNRPDPRLG